MRKIISTTCRIVLLMAVFLFCGQAAVHARTIGVLMTGDIAYYRKIHQALLDKVSGYLNEQNIEIVTQAPLPNPMAWTNAARKLKALGAEVIVAYGLPATLATMKETSNNNCLQQHHKTAQKGFCSGQ